MASLHTLPVEVKHEILKQVPINSTLQKVALSGAFAESVFYDITLCHQHIRQSMRVHSSWDDFVAVNSLYNVREWDALPIVYKALLLRESFSLTEGRQVAWSYWKLRESQAMRVVAIWMQSSGWLKGSERMLEWASLNGYWQIVTNLISSIPQSYGIDYDLVWNLALIQNEVGVVQALVSRLDPSVNDSRALCTAAAHDSADVVKILLKCDVDPRAMNYRSLEVAIEQFHIDTLRALLSDSRVQFVTFIYMCVVSIASYVHREVGPAFLFSFLCFYVVSAKAA
ncbi:hypothetical protein BCR33DRAFT_710985 [Rhizoclosmatium globosum]|uniref:Uncharacterized protein n=1 Tax=Rhizoclosmatium globosum TaxID=329046 RepID=A0A1Y2D2W0_9FUNG|nr:hypothetical protein BCR33DRAFT_710985 [Rhizoclosmatium globosum]|eukprot:ORY53590.1 hypothetical protein BCR33DRAFT_710985 [Rhizoclosmatium globosum]